MAGKYILDIGSGLRPNPEANLFLEKNIAPTDDRDVAGKKKSAQRAVVKGNFVIGDGCYLPFKTGSIEKVVSNHVIEHVDNPLEFLAEARRVSGGNIHIVFPNIMNEISRFLFIDDYALKVHKWAYNHNTGVWVSMREVYESRPRYTWKQRAFIWTLRHLPRKIVNNCFLSPIYYILDEYYRKFGITFVDGEIR